MASLTDPTRPVELSIGSRVADRYEIRSTLGRGGMGAVYSACDTTTGGDCALKALLPDLLDNDRVRARFRFEATIASQVHSEHVARVLDAGVDDNTNTPFIVMELLHGRDLGQALAQDGPLPMRQVALYVEHIAKALDCAHAADIVHRDLKPENVFVACSDEGSAVVKLLDFGIAKIVSTSTFGKQTTGLLGTPLFMTPEQMHREQPLSPQTDIYALAQLAYAMLTSEPYWTAEKEEKAGLYKLFVAMMDGPSEPPCARATRRAAIALPAGFDAWFARSTATAPSERYPSAGQCAKALAAALDLG